MAKNKFNTQYLIDASYMDLSGLSATDLRAAARQIIHTAEQRYAAGVKKFGALGALKTYGEKTHARARRTQSGDIVGTMPAGKQSIKGKNDAEIIREIEIAQRFLRSKTSTYKGRMEVVKKTAATLGVKLDPKQYAKLWETFNKVEELAASGYLPSFYAVNYKEILDKIITEVKEQGAGYTVDSFLSRANEYIDSVYYEAQVDQADAEEYYEWLRGGVKPNESVLERLRRHGVINEDIIDDTDV